MVVGARAVLSLLLAATIALAPRGVCAAQPDTDAIEVARNDFAEGQSQFQAKRWAEALKAFERSYGTVPSPNTELMVARCLRELGRRADAAQAYASAALEAKARVARGESKYGQTADAATNEGNAVRAQLGTIHVRVERPGGVQLVVDKKAVALSKEGEATIVHEPGIASVSVTDVSGAEQRQTVTVLAGATVQMDFAPQATPPAKPEPKPEKAPTPPPREAPPPADHDDAMRPWAWPGAIVGGAVTALGLGIFAGFALTSQSRYDDLVARCGHECGPADRADAETGKTQQAIANVALGVAITAAAATVAFIVIALTDPKRH